LGDGEDLLLGFYRAGPGNQLKMRAADFQLAHLDDAVVRVKLAVGTFEGLADPLDRLHHVQAGQQLLVDAGGVADEPQNRVILTLGQMHLKSPAGKPLGQVFYLVVGCFSF
jgi:hypothetical protein